MSDKKFFNKDMTVGQVVEMFPPAADILMGYGLHCVGCFANSFETVEQGVMGHGYSEEDLNELIDDLNEAYEDEKKGKPVKKVSAKDADKMEVTVTDKAKKKILAIAIDECKETFPLRIEARPTAGKLKYSMNFVDPQSTSKQDKGFSFGKVKLVVSKSLYEYLNGLEIDYVEEENRAGFKMNNPNV